jgi:hypothetical protein
MSGGEFFHIKAPTVWETMKLGYIIAEWREQTLRRLQQIRDDKLVVARWREMLAGALSRGEAKEAEHIRQELRQFQTTVM